MASRLPLKTTRQMATVAEGFADSPMHSPRTVSSALRRLRNQERLFERTGVPFMLGGVKKYLPGFTIQFNRTPNLSASWAQFTVPLWFNKLDLRDYLWNVYNVRTHGIRTYVLPSAIRPRKNPLPGKKKLIRPQNKKRMTVELDNPFVWPDPPTVAELNEGWKKDMIRTVSKGKYKAAIGREEGLREQREELRERAQRLIKGAERWSTIKPFQGPQGLTRMFSRR